MLSTREEDQIDKHGSYERKWRQSADNLVTKYAWIGSQ